MTVEKSPLLTPTIKSIHVQWRPRPGCSTRSLSLPSRRNTFPGTSPAAFPLLKRVCSSYRTGFTHDEESDYKWAIVRGGAHQSIPSCRMIYC